MSHPRSTAFPAVRDGRTRVLILGSLPGVRSIERAEYYAHPRNAFWRLAGAVIGTDLAGLPYLARLEVLLDAGIGLSDVVASDVRPGSLDASIREPELADVAALVNELRDLKAVAFNGVKAARIGRSQIIDMSGPDLVDLPSSSPAYAAMPFGAKLTRWTVLQRYL
jgi:hypoxanthine-DNA glycosylase